MQSVTDLLTDLINAAEKKFKLSGRHCQKDHVWMGSPEASRDGYVCGEWVDWPVTNPMMAIGMIGQTTVVVNVFRPDTGSVELSLLGPEAFTLRQLWDELLKA